MQLILKEENSGVISIKAILYKKEKISKRLKKSKVSSNLAKNLRSRFFK